MDIKIMDKRKNSAVRFDYLNRNYGAIFSMKVLQYDLNSGRGIILLRFLILEKKWLAFKTYLTAKTKGHFKVYNYLESTIIAAIGLAQIYWFPYLKKSILYLKELRSETRWTPLRGCRLWNWVNVFINLREQNITVNTPQIYQDFHDNNRYNVILIIVCHLARNSPTASKITVGVNETQKNVFIIAFQQSLRPGKIRLIKERQYLLSYETSKEGVLILLAPPETLEDLEEA